MGCYRARAKNAEGLFLAVLNALRKGVCAHEAHGVHARVGKGERIVSRVRVSAGLGFKKKVSGRGIDTRGGAKHGAHFTFAGWQVVLLYT